MIERTAHRVEPRLPVTLALHEPGKESTFGLVANISGRGACVLTFGDFEVGSEIRCALSFPKQLEPLRVTGQVVWTERFENAPSRCGVHFQISSNQVADLQGLIAQVSPN